MTYAIPKQAYVQKVDAWVNKLDNAWMWHRLNFIKSTVPLTAKAKRRATLQRNEFRKAVKELNRLLDVPLR